MVNSYDCTSYGEEPPNGAPIYISEFVAEADGSPQWSLKQRLTVLTGNHITSHQTLSPIPTETLFKPITNDSYNITIPCHK